MLRYYATLSLFEEVEMGMAPMLMVTKAEEGQGRGAEQDAAKAEEGQGRAAEAAAAAAATAASFLNPPGSSIVGQFWKVINDGLS